MNPKTSIRTIGDIAPNAPNRYNGPIRANGAGDAMVSVTIYTTGPKCAQCTMTKRQFEKLGVPFREVNVINDDGAREYIMTDLGYSSAPVVVVEDGTGEDHWSGLRPDHIKRVATLHTEYPQCP